MLDLLNSVDFAPVKGVIQHLSCMSFPKLLVHVTYGYWTPGGEPSKRAVLKWVARGCLSVSRDFKMDRGLKFLVGASGKNASNVFMLYWHDLNHVIPGYSLYFAFLNSHKCMAESSLGSTWFYLPHSGTWVTWLFLQSNKKKGGPVCVRCMCKIFITLLFISCVENGRWMGKIL